MKAFALNLVIAVIWLLLSEQPSTGVFFIGFAIGFVMLTAFCALLDGGDYPRRCLALTRFVAIFSLDFVKANLSVARTVLFESRAALHPGFIHYDVSRMRPAEILLLSYCITLTPGTTTVSVSEDFRTLVVHALDAESPDETRRQIAERLEQPILRFTR